MVSTQTTWRRCSNCKKEIALGARYHVCSVASCTKVRAPVQFCSADCWAVHNEVENHKDAWAVEQTAPKTSSEGAVSSPSPARAKPDLFSGGAVSSPSPARAKPDAGPPPASLPPVGSSPAPTAASAAGDEVMVVVSRFKDYIRDVSSGMSTSDQVLEPISAHVRRLADLAIESAKRAERKTVLGRDVARPGPVQGGGGDVVLVVVSRLKEYVRAQSDLRTSDDVPPALSDEVRRIALFAIENARKDGRKTVMGRDIPT